MGGKSNFLASKLQDHVLGNIPYTPPSVVYVALYTTSPSAAGGGVEVSGGGYTRLAVTNNETNWPNATGTNTSVKYNGTALIFDVATTSWGTITSFALYDSASSGNELIWAVLTESKLISIGDTPKFGVGSLVWKEI